MVVAFQIWVPLLMEISYFCTIRSHLQETDKFELTKQKEAMLFTEQLCR